MKKTSKGTIPFWGTHQLQDTFDLCRCLVAECLGSAILIWLATTNCAQFPDNTDVLKISLTIGLTVSTVVMIFVPVSGANINPVITLGILIVGRISLFKAVLYVIAQILGVIVGTIVYEATTPVDVQGPDLCSNGINTAAGVTVQQALAVETILTFILIYWILVFSDPNVHPHPGGMGIVALGLYVAGATLFGLSYSGVALNPARSIGLAILKHILWDGVWVYWVGPILGSVIAGLVYRNCFDVAFQ
uniref:Aquaporin n=1 Tax=Graphocephala atropunctata TaxID=36148 RepID=A0A1B6M1X0_9HEMI